jgi:GPH family glycoside/pentoside/hexuronide:cation symporter/probable glucitol transport protein GutA
MIDRRTKAAYGLGSVGNNLIYGLLTTYLMVYYTDTFGLPLAAIGTLFVVARTLDALSDPFIGHLVDKTSSRWGRFRPWLLFGPPVMAVVVVLVFSSPNFSPEGKVLWAYATYIAWGVAFASMDIPFWSLSAALTQDPRERSSLIMIPRTLATLAIIGVNVFTLPLVGALGGSDPKSGWFWVAVVFGAASLVFTLVTFFGVKERVMPEAGLRLKFRDVVAFFRTNRPLRLLIVSMLIGDVILSIKTVFTVYYLTYNYGNADLVPVFLGIYALATVTGSVLSPLLARKLGKKNLALWGTGLSAVASLGMFATGFPQVALLGVWTVLGGFMDGTSDIVRMSMLADTMEYGEWKTGKRQEGMVFSTNIFKTKVASAVGGGLAAFTLALVHYVPNAVQKPEVLAGIHLSYTLVPGVIALAALWPLALYDLTEDKFQTIVADLKTRRQP